MMRIRVVGGGWYGCHIAKTLIDDGHVVELHEQQAMLFAGASGANPARLHLGFHYPRSKLTRAACQRNNREFMQHYGHLTHGVRTNVYAVADESLVDFGTYLDTLRGEVDLLPVDPAEYGLRNCEGAVLTAERHIVIGMARALFEGALAGHVRYGVPFAGYAGMPDFDVTIDCTFCSAPGANAQRFEPCVVGLLTGPVDTAVTIMDGPFPSIYPWNEGHGVCSISSARYTPLDRCDTYAAAAAVLDDEGADAICQAHVEMMREQMAAFWPASRELFATVGFRKAIRSLPSSKADARIVDVAWSDDATIAIRAGKIDAIFDAARQVQRMIAERL